MAKSTREVFHEREDLYLASYAIKSKNSRGRIHDEPSSESRTCFQRDRDRVIHSKSFRRLKHKTQVFVAPESDHYRSRLTHTIEVAQISRHLARILQVNEDLAETIALAHDLGHSPFGHAGERTLNELLKDDGGFEHNLQSLRIIDTLEKKYPNFDGLNLSFEVRAGLQKHSKTVATSLEAQLVNMADQIAYNNHDLDDGLQDGILIESELDKHVDLWAITKKQIQDEYHGLQHHERHHLINSRLISDQINNLVATTSRALKEHDIHTLADLQDAPTLANFDHGMTILNNQLRRYLFDNLYTHDSVLEKNKMGQQIITKLFEHFKPTMSARDLADYISGMTDTFAMRIHASC